MSDEIVVTGRAPVTRLLRRCSRRFRGFALCDRLAEGGNVAPEAVEAQLARQFAGSHEELGGPLAVPPRVTVTLRFRRTRGRRRAAGTLRRTGRSGANRVAFSGRVGRRALRRGTYRLIATAIDAAGNRSTARTKRFRIVN